MNLICNGWIYINVLVSVHWVEEVGAGGVVEFREHSGQDPDVEIEYSRFGDEEMQPWMGV